MPLRKPLMSVIASSAVVLTPSAALAADTKAPAMAVPCAVAAWPHPAHGFAACRCPAFVEYRHFGNAAGGARPSLSASRVRIAARASASLR
jgi:hypothetical protein